MSLDRQRQGNVQDGARTFCVPDAGVPYLYDSSNGQYSENDGE